MTWTKVLTADTLASDGRQLVKVGKRKILVINHKGQLYAVDNTCPHLKMPMKNGKITESGAILCPIHRSAFDLLSGEVQEWCPWPPGVGKVMGMIAEQKKLPVFPVRVEEGSIWIDLQPE
ncbi:Rieske (2Fe-2S) protein [Chrysosporum bergii ANA360D]|uniref:Rieske (2Fe-2S) protein n=1 Tax=Chrysosporum bergii ANA360D TaxID=617107 RepID=A0AA43GT76_9CYAN|nr:Rieske (2Fe-2S) protein [Chrysosporum bergii]MDH6060542.1 Rieske (2Fe-2S) protein [Chrysosporum bergii ANA360D]